MKRPEQARRTQNKRQGKQVKPDLDRGVLENMEERDKGTLSKTKVSAAGKIDIDWMVRLSGGGGQREEEVWTWMERRLS